MAPPLILDDPVKRAEVIRLLDLGYTTRSIGAAIGCNHNTIRLFAISNNITVKSPRARHAAAAKNLILTENLTPKEVAEKLGLKLATIYSYVSDDPEVQLVRQRQSIEREKARAARRNEARNARRRAAEPPKPVAARPIVAKPEPELSGINWNLRRPAQNIPLPPIDPASAQALIEQFLKTKGVTKCPTMFVAPTQIYRDPQPSSNSTSPAAKYSSTLVMRPGAWDSL